MSGVGVGSAWARALLGQRRRRSRPDGADARAVGAGRPAARTARHAHDDHDLRPSGADDQRHRSRPGALTRRDAHRLRRQQRDAALRPRARRARTVATPAAATCADRSSRQTASGSASSTAATRSGRSPSPVARRSRSPLLDGALHAAPRGRPTTRSSSRPTTRRRGCSACRPHGGTPEVLTRPDHAQGEADHLWPELLPGGRAVLFTITSQTGGLDTAQVAVRDLQTGTQKVLLRGGSHGHYVASGLARSRAREAAGRCARSPSIRLGWRRTERWCRCCRSSSQDTGAAISPWPPTGRSSTWTRVVGKASRRTSTYTSVPSRAIPNSPAPDLVVTNRGTTGTAGRATSRADRRGSPAASRPRRRRDGRCNIVRIGPPRTRTSASPCADRVPRLGRIESAGRGDREEDRAAAGKALRPQVVGFVVRAIRPSQPGRPAVRPTRAAGRSSDCLSRRRSCRRRPRRAAAAPSQGVD